MKIAEIYSVSSDICHSPLANKKYDFIFSLGQACNCAATLRINMLRYQSFPFDWVFSGGGFAERFSILLNDFNGYFDKENLELSYNDGESVCYRNKISGIEFPHDFSKNDIFLNDDIYLPIKKKYDRRISRLLKILNTKNYHVLCVYIERSDYLNKISNDEIMSLFYKARLKFKANLDILYVKHENSFMLSNLFLETISKNIFIAKINNSFTEEDFSYGNRKMLSWLFNNIYNKQVLTLKKYSSTGKLFIYGAGERAMYIAKMLIDREINFSGFIISKGQEKKRNFHKFGKNIFYPNELPYPTSEIIIFYGLDSENTKQVKKYLKKNNIIFSKKINLKIL
jgi:hypothetical protein